MRIGRGLFIDVLSMSFAFEYQGGILFYVSQSCNSLAAEPKVYLQSLRNHQRAVAVYMACRGIPLSIPEQ